MLIKFGKEMIEVGEVGGHTTLHELKERVEFATGCVDVKLILKGKHLNSNLLETVGSIPGGTLAKISAIGSRQAEINRVNQSQSDRNVSRVVNDLDGTVRRSDVPSSRSSDRKRSQYCFGGIQTLPGLPNEGTARSILEELSVDVGVLAVMEKHKFKVGALCELYPEGYVGVSDVCVMGLNEGNGIRILLRLRTDDLKGFRKILSIRKVLFHELAHNMHSDHDSNFYMLMRQIEREVVELDWRASKAKLVGGQAAANVYIPSESASHQSRTSKSDVYLLGGGERTEGRGEGRVVLPARVAAGTAAIMRLSEEESRAERSCASANIKLQTQILSSVRNIGRTVDGSGDRGVSQGAAEGHAAVMQGTDTYDAAVAIDNTIVGNYMDVDVVDSDSSSSNSEDISMDMKMNSSMKTNMDCGEAQHVMMDITAEDELSISHHDSAVDAVATIQMIGAEEVELEERREGKGEEEGLMKEHVSASASTSSESVHFEYMAGCVLRQLDEVVFAALSTSESAFERVSMLREALAVLLSHGHLPTHPVPAPGNLASSDSVLSILPLSSVADALDTMQLLRTIIGNAKVVYILSHPIESCLQLHPPHSKCFVHSVIVYASNYFTIPCHTVQHVTAPISNRYALEYCSLRWNSISSLFCLLFSFPLLII
jgi:WLM domain